MNDLTPRRKWALYLAGEDVGQMVSPLCDDWSLDIPYAWSGEGPEPFPSGHRWHALSQQMAMAHLCGWDPTFLCGIDFKPRGADAVPRITTHTEGTRTRTETRYTTPYGDLWSVVEREKTLHVVKPWIETADDFRRAIWLTGRQKDYDEDGAVAQGREILAAVGERGVVGTWFGPPMGNFVDREQMFFLMADFPEAYEELRQASWEHALKIVSTLRKAGFDYLFYCVDGCEWISPDFFRRYVLEQTREIFRRWRAEGGWILWHSCGRIRQLVEAGFYNDLKPEIFETVSQPPVGNLPSLRWARERLAPEIATKGNIPLNVLLFEKPEDVRAEVRRVLDETRGWRHIVGLSDDLLKGTPLANARALVAESRKA